MVFHAANRAMVEVLMHCLDVDSAVCLGAIANSIEADLADIELAFWFAKAVLKQGSHDEATGQNLSIATRHVF